MTNKKFYEMYCRSCDTEGIFRRDGKMITKDEATIETLEPYTHKDYMTCIMCGNTLCENEQMVSDLVEITNVIDIKLGNKLEELMSQYTEVKEEDRQLLSGRIKFLALVYKDITGDYYFRTK